MWLEKVKKYNPEGDFVPLKVTFEMTTPIVLSHPWIHFDGLIAHFLLKEILGNEYYLLPGRGPIDFTSVMKLPLLKNEYGFFHTSVSIFEPKRVFATRIYKRFDDKNIERTKSKKKRIYLGSGYFKSFMISLPYIPARKVIFYCNGIETEIERLLKEVPGLGKKVDIGFGEIKSFKIKKIERDHSLVKNGKAMRPIPAEFVESFDEIVNMAYKPPYWAKENVTLCVPPLGKVKIKKKR